MPRRNRRQRVRKSRLSLPFDPPPSEPTSYEAIARQLVIRGLAAPDILDRPTNLKENHR